MCDALILYDVLWARYLNSCGEYEQQIEAVSPLEAAKAARRLFKSARGVPIFYVDDEATGKKYRVDLDDNSVEDE